MSTFVCSDLHNNWTMFSKLLDIVKFKDTDTLVINGDLIDRGTTTKPFVEFIRKHEEQIIYILGNHEQMFIEAYETGKLFDKLVEIETNTIFYGGANKPVKRLVPEDEVVNLWIYNGGIITLQTLDKDEIDWLYNYYKTKCSYYKFIGDNLFVHAGPHLYDKDYTRESIEDSLAKEDIHNLIWDRNFFTKYAVLKRTVGISTPCNIFIGHNSMVGTNLNFEAVTETRLDNGYKIIATDMSDISGKDLSMMIYDLGQEKYYIAREGRIGEYEFLEEQGYNNLYLTDRVGRYAHLTRFNKKCLEKYNKKNEPITEEEFYERFLIGGDNVHDYL